MLENDGFDYSMGRMSCTSYTEAEPGASVQPDAPAFDELFEKVSGQYSVYRLKRGKTIIIVDGRHRRISILNIANMQGVRFDWARGELQIQYIYRVDGKQLTRWEILVFSKNKNRASALVRADNSLQNMLRHIFSYAATFRLTYGIQFLDASTTNLAKDVSNNK